MILSRNNNSCVKIKLFVLNSHVLSLEISVDASCFTVIYFPAPHRCVSGLYDVIRAENTRSFLLSNTHVRQDEIKIRIRSYTDFG